MGDDDQFDIELELEEEAAAGTTGQAGATHQSGSGAGLQDLAQADSMMAGADDNLLSGLGEEDDEPYQPPSARQQQQHQQNQQQHHQQQPPQQRQQQQPHQQQKQQQPQPQEQQDQHQDEGMTEDDAYMMMMAEANAAADEQDGQAANGTRDVLQEAIDNHCTLFIGGLNWWTTDAEVEAACARFGTLQLVRFLEERATGKSKGVAVVEFVDPEATALCKEQLQGQEVGGQKVLLKWAGQFASGPRANGMAMRPGGPLPPGAFAMNGMQGRGPGRAGFAGGRGAGRYSEPMVAGRGRGGARFEGMHPMMAMHAGMGVPMMPGMPHPAMMGAAGMMGAMPPFAMAPGMMAGTGAAAGNMARPGNY